MEEDVEARYEPGKSRLSAFRGIKATLLNKKNKIKNTLAPLTNMSTFSSLCSVPSLLLCPPQLLRAWRLDYGLSEFSSRELFRNPENLLAQHKGHFKAGLPSCFFPAANSQPYIYLGVLLHACRVLSVILLGGFAFEPWLSGCGGFLSSEEDTGMVLTAIGVEGKSLLLPGVLHCTVGLPGSTVLFGGVPSTSLGTGETRLGDWPFFSFFSAVLGVLKIIAGFSFRGTPSSSSSKVTKEQYPSVEEIARKDPSLDLVFI